MVSRLWGVADLPWRQALIFALAENPDAAYWKSGKVTDDGETDNTRYIPDRRLQIYNSRSQTSAVEVVPGCHCRHPAVSDVAGWFCVSWRARFGGLARPTHLVRASANWMPHPWRFHGWAAIPMGSGDFAGKPMYSAILVATSLLPKGSRWLAKVGGKVANVAGKALAVYSAYKNMQQEGCFR